MSAQRPPSSPALPGEELIRKGSADLDAGIESMESLLVSIGAPRLARLGFVASSPLATPEHRLYRRLAAENPDSAHSRYNALVRRLVSFERAAECASHRYPAIDRRSFGERVERVFGQHRDSQ